MEFTLVTQSSESRLWLMKHHGDRWKGNISIAVLSNRTREMVFSDMERLWNCASGQVEVTTLNAPEEDYPVNQLRNLALRMVKTTHFICIDVDFWVSTNLQATLISNEIRNTFAKDYKLALVVPAFQLDNGVCEEGSKEKCHRKDLDSMPSTTEELFPMLKERVITKKRRDHNKYGWRVTPFKEKVFPLAQNATLYAEWFKQGLGDLVQIPCVQSRVYEPYVATRYCRDMPQSRIYIIQLVFVMKK
jgi:acetolactate synthase regulatory subunit